MFNVPEALFAVPGWYRVRYGWANFMIRLLGPLYRDRPDLYAFLEEMVPVGASVLDAGCGAGELYRRLRSKRLTYSGFDVSPNAITYCQREFPEANWGTEMPAGHFDVALLGNVLHHVREPERTALLRACLERADRVLIYEPILDDRWPVRWCQRIYWMVTDGGHSYAQLDGLHRLYGQLGAQISYEAVSVPIHQFYAASVH